MTNGIRKGTEWEGRQSFEEELVMGGARLLGVPLL